MGEDGVYNEGRTGLKKNSWPRNSDSLEPSPIFSAAFIGIAANLDSKTERS